MFFRQHWKDQRLSQNMTSKITLTMGTKRPVDYIWVPDTVFVDATKSYMHNVLATNHKIDISADGQVDWGTRLVTVWNLLDLYQRGGLSSVLSWTSIILAGKRDSRSHSATGLSENVLRKQIHFAIDFVGFSRLSHSHLAIKAFW